MLCPSHFDTCMKWVPAESWSVANVWRRSWSRTPSTAGTFVPSASILAGVLAGSPTAARAGRNTFL